MKRLVVFLPRHETSWFKMKLIIDKSIVPSKKLDYVVIISSNKIKEIVNNSKKKYKILDLIKELNNTKNPFIIKILKKIDIFLEDKSFLTNFFLLGFFKSFMLKERLLFEKKVFLYNFKKLKPFWLMLPGDRELSPVPPAIKAANELKINSVISVTSTPDPLCLHKQRTKYRDFYVYLYQFAPLLNFFIQKKFPKQIFKHKNNATLFSPGWRTLGLYNAGMISLNPWAQGGGSSDFIFESNYEYCKINHNLGVPKRKIVLVGDPATDKLYSLLKNKKYIKKKVKEKELKIVFALPNDAEHDLCSWEIHINRIKKISDVLNKFEKCKIFIALHPKCLIKNYQFLIDEYKFKFTNKNLSEILPYCNICIICASSTFFWGALCGISVINFDYEKIYKLWNKKIMKIKNGVYTVCTINEFKKCYFKVLKEVRKKKYKDLLIKQSKMLSTRFLFDGKVSKRITKFLVNNEGVYRKN